MGTTIGFTLSPPLAAQREPGRSLDKNMKNKSKVITLIVFGISQAVFIPSIFDCLVDLQLALAPLAGGTAVLINGLGKEENRLSHKTSLILEFVCLLELSTIFVLIFYILEYCAG